MNKLYATKETLKRFGLSEYAEEINDFLGQHAHAYEVLDHLHDYFTILPPSFDPTLQTMIALVEYRIADTSTGNTIDPLHKK